MVNKITTAVAVLTTASTVYLGVQVHVLETDIKTQVDKSTALAVQRFERDIFAQAGAIAKAQRQAELNQRAAITRDLNSIPQVLLEGR